VIGSLSFALRGALALLGLIAWLLVPLGAGSTVEAADDPVTRVIELTNAERQKAGLSPLAAQANLMSAAQGYAGVLASGTCFAHTCGPVPDFSDRATQAGYSSWNALAENIAAGQRSPEAVVQAWMESPGHRANILNARYTEIGVGLATGGRMGMYWAQSFGARRGAAVGSPAPGTQVAPAPTTIQAPPTTVQPPRGANGCTFVLGFAQLRALVGSAAGTCTENEHFNPLNGNAEQATTGGMFVWRKADNWTAFTDGYRTWINGPQGLQSRLNVQRFAWESDPL
jgi:Cysteine-rich secretory protein family